MYHPGSIAAGKFKWLSVLKLDLDRLRRSSTGNLQPLDVQWDTRCPTGFARNVSATIDIETDRSGRIECVGIGLDDGHIHVLTWSPAVRDFITEVLADCREVVGHNLAFDLPRLAAHGVHLPASVRLWDTFHAAHLLLPDFFKGLGRVAPLYLDTHRWKHLSAVDPVRYNATDVAATRALRARFEPLLHEYNLESLFETVSRAIRPLIAMTERGISVDTARLSQWRQDLQQQLQQANAAWVRLAGAVNPGSPAQLSKHFYGSHRGGGWTAEDALQRLVVRRPHHAPAVQALLERRRVSKLLSTYASITVGSDGCVHPQFLPFDKEAERGTASTGRLAATDPNIQNQPLPARRIFRCRIPGGRLWEFDYSQIELRLAAALSSDPGLQSGLRDGDVHARTMLLMRCDRTRAKNVTYGTLYGASPSTLAGILTTSGFPTSIEEAAALQSAFARAYPVLWRWRSAVAVLGATQGYLANPFGRRRWFHGNYIDAQGEVQGPTVPEMYDYLPQSTAADIMWQRLVPLDSLVTSMGGVILAQVHDSFLLEMPPETDPIPVITLLESEVPEIAPGFFVPVSVKMGENWGEMKEWAR